MDWKYLLTSFDGRINRAKFWAAIGIFIALAVIGMIIDSILGSRIDLGGGGQLGHHFKTAVGLEIPEEEHQPPAWLSELPREYDRGPPDQAPRHELVRALFDRM